MADLSEIEARLVRLEEIEALKRLKYRYWRCLDLKSWDELRDLFIADASVSYGSGRYEFKGVDAIMRFLTESLAVERGAMTIHHGHHPEIELTSPTTATATWALYNYMYNVKQNRAIRIGAYYHDDCVKVADGWKLKHVGYKSLFQEEWKRDDIPSVELIDSQSK